jgi:hypothetical protein
MPTGYSSEFRKPNSDTGPASLTVPPGPGVDNKVGKNRIPEGRMTEAVGALGSSGCDGSGEPRLMGDRSAARATPRNGPATKEPWARTGS